MGSLKELYFLKEKKQYNDTKPDEEEDAEDGFSACVHYKDVEVVVQHNSNEQPASTSCKLDGARLVVGKR